jgi:hypothetical protein
MDGINAMPLVRDAGGGRRCNVEADLFLLIESAGKYQLAACEVKHCSGTPWYAAIENLRQLKLLLSSRSARRLFPDRNPNLALPEEIPCKGLVIAPAAYYVKPGQSKGVASHTRELLQQFKLRIGLDLALAVWDSSRKSIDPL